jgi:hypothetical protein
MILAIQKTRGSGFLILLDGTKTARQSPCENRRLCEYGRNGQRKMLMKPIQGEKP